MDSLSPLQQIFLTQEWNQGLLPCKQILYQLSYKGSPKKWKWKSFNRVQLFTTQWTTQSWISPGQNTGVGSLSRLHRILPTHRSNPGLPHCRQILYHLSYQGSLRILQWVANPFFRRSSWPRNRTRGFCIAGGFFTSWPSREALPLSISSVTQSCLTLWPHGLQHASLPCPLPTPGVCANSYPLSQWCHSTIPSSVIPCSSCLQSFPASGLFQWVSSLHQVAKVLELQLQHQSLQWIFRTDFL